MAIRYIEVVKGTSDAKYPADRTFANAAGTYVDSNDSYKFKYNKNGTVVTVLDDQGGVGGNARLPVFNTTDKAMGNSASAISLFTVTVASLKASGGFIVYNYFGTDGTDVHSLTGLVTYATANKAGTLTTQITEVAGNQAKAATAGTITIAWTIVDGGAGLATIKAATTDSLTTTTAVLSYTVTPLRGTVVLV